MTISGNLVSNSPYAITLQGAGSLMGNTVYCGSSQIGINLDGGLGPVLLDQNTVIGAGTHFTPGSASYVKGTNAGF